MTGAFRILPCLGLPEKSGVGSKTVHLLQHPSLTAPNYLCYTNEHLQSTQHNIAHSYNSYSSLSNVAATIISLIIIHLIPAQLCLLTYSQIFDD